VSAVVDKLVGRTLAKRYRIVRPIGTGGMGVVYEAEHVALGRRVALKVLTHTDERALERFHQEATATAKLDSPHIVAVTDFNKSADGPAFIVMELLEGESLHRKIKREGALTLGIAVPIAVQLLSGLAAAHRARIVHRDVKPANIFILSSEAGDLVVKLLDFGIAKLAAEAGRFKTTVGTVLGTPAYLAPEQIMGGVVDARTDVHAVGLTLYEMLTGERPWGGRRGAELGLAIVQDSPKPIKRADVSMELAAIVARAVAKDPNHRFADANEMRDALRSLGIAAERIAPIAVEQTAEDPAHDTIRESMRDTAGETATMVPAITTLPLAVAPVAAPAAPAAAPARPVAAPAAPAPSVPAPAAARLEASPPPSRTGVGSVLVVAVLLAVAAIAWLKWRGGNSVAPVAVVPSAPPSVAPGPFSVPVVATRAEATATAAVPRGSDVTPDAEPPRLRPTRLAPVALGAAAAAESTEAAPLAPLFAESPEPSAASPPKASATPKTVEPCPYGQFHDPFDGHCVKL
jgi:eukaryotic-like serine/threonine-protein kinase